MGCGFAQLACFWLTICFEIHRKFVKCFCYQRLELKGAKVGQTLAKIECESSWQTLVGSSIRSRQILYMDFTDFLPVNTSGSTIYAFYKAIKNNSWFLQLLPPTIWHQFRGYTPIIHTSKRSNRKNVEICTYWTIYSSNFHFKCMLESRQIFWGNLLKNKRHLHIIWSFSIFNVKYSYGSWRSRTNKVLNEFYIRRSSFWIAKYCLYAVMNTNWKCSNVEQSTCVRRTHTHTEILWDEKKWFS